MRITQAKYYISLGDIKQFEGEPMPEIAMVGRSNVGKSSLINALTNNNKLARISSTPGKTRLINYYELNEKFYLVDLPGYGFAKVAKGERERWTKMINGYLQQCKQLRHVFFLVDMRHDPSEQDLVMNDWLIKNNIAYSVIGTKTDKVKKQQRAKRILDLAFYLKLNMSSEIIPFSVPEKLGKEEILQRIAQATGEA